MTNNARITVRLSIDWWLCLYFSGVAVMCYVTGRRPDMDRVEFWIRRAIRVRVE